MNKNVAWIVVVILLSLLLIASLVLNAVGFPAVANYGVVDLTSANTALPTSTPDPCSSENIAEQAAQVNSLTREFEDTALLLTSTLLRDTSVSLVQDLQRIKRRAEDNVVPPCLNDLKAYQTAHMNARIEVFGTALAFLNAYGPNGDQEKLNALLEPHYVKAGAAARQYENEYARLLGSTPAPTVPVATETP